MPDRDVGIPDEGSLLRRLGKSKKADKNSAAVVKKGNRAAAVLHEDATGTTAAALFKPETPAKIEPGTLIRFDEPGVEDFRDLGEMLVYLRRTYFTREDHANRDRPRVELKAAAVVEYLREHGYSMTSGSYSLLEHGETLPRNPTQFFDIIGACLGIDTSSKYYALLRGQYLYDHAVRYVGKEYADKTVLHGPQLLEDLRRRQSPTGPHPHVRVTR